MDYGSKAEATVVQMSDQGTFRQAGRHGLPGCFSCLPAGRLVLLSLSKDLQKQKRTNEKFRFFAYAQNDKRDLSLSKDMQKQKRTNEKLDSSPAFSVIRMTKRSD
ncbi:MAG: hypothetical protein J0L54_14835 [Chitinophagales bacterium]|nr:hypothetical protein [Chitinophagales bacterium]